MRPDTAETLGGMALWAVPALVVLLALQRPGERFGDTTFRYRVILGGYLVLGLMFLRGGWIVFAYAALAVLALIGIGCIAEVIHNRHLRHQGRQHAGSR